MSHNSVSQPIAYKAEELQSMKVSEIKSLANGLGYGLKAMKKKDMIDEFLAQQGTLQ